MCVPGVHTLPVGRVFLPSPPRNWTSIETGKLLLLPHALGRLAVDHHAAVAKRPARPAGALVAHETVLDPKPIVRVLVLREQVPELAVELGVPVVANLQDTVFHAEGVRVVLAQGVARDLGRPAVEVLTVEQADPLAAVLRRGVETGQGKRPTNIGASLRAMTVERNELRRRVAFIGRSLRTHRHRASGLHRESPATWPGRSPSRG